MRYYIQEEKRGKWFWLISKGSDGQPVSPLMTWPASWVFTIHSLFNFLYIPHHSPKCDIPHLLYSGLIALQMSLLNQLELQILLRNMTKIYKSLASQNILLQNSFHC